MARDERPRLVNEILDQNARLRGYFAEVLMLSAWSHPDTLKIIEMAIRVAQMVAIHFKLKFNRARPQQVCPALVPLINSPGHASFPSAHSLESHMIALALTEVQPHKHRASTAKVLTALADRIGRNREVAGVHYPSDTKAGKEIACAAFELLKECPIFQSVLRAAREEPGGVGRLRPPPECIAGRNRRKSRRRN
jgi:acid phosphatase (class A)